MLTVKTSAKIFSTAQAQTMMLEGSFQPDVASTCRMSLSFRYLSLLLSSVWATCRSRSGGRENVWLVALGIIMLTVNMLVLFVCVTRVGKWIGCVPYSLKGFNIPSFNFPTLKKLLHFHKQTKNSSTPSYHHVKDSIEINLETITFFIARKIRFWWESINKVRLMKT